jgi:hypothetical protein
MRLSYFAVIVPAIYLSLVSVDTSDLISVVLMKIPVGKM